MSGLIRGVQRSPLSNPLKMSTNRNQTQVCCPYMSAAVCVKVRQYVHVCVCVCGRSSGSQNNRTCSKIKNTCRRRCKPPDKSPHNVTKCAVVLVCSPGYDGCPCVCAGRRNQKSLACCDSRPPLTLSAEHQKG